MRVVVTGPLNPVGRAIVQELSKAGHTVRAFGVPAGEDPFHDANVECFPGWVQVGGSLEPVAVESQAIIHAASCDEPGKDAAAHAVRVEMGTLYARYAAERELVSRFVTVLPAKAGRFTKSLDAARATVQATKILVPHSLVEAGSPGETAQEVARILTHGLALPLGSAEKPAPPMPGAPRGH